MHEPPSASRQLTATMGAVAVVAIAVLIVVLIVGASKRSHNEKACADAAHPFASWYDAESLYAESVFRVGICYRATETGWERIDDWQQP